jgi:hypothetical protein
VGSVLAGGPGVLLLSCFAYSHHVSLMGRIYFWNDSRRHVPFLLGFGGRNLRRLVSVVWFVVCVFFYL